MPSFGLSSLGLNSPSSSSVMPLGEESSSSRQRPSMSVQLSCLSPDSRAVHSLHSSNRMIETHTLPLAGTVQESMNAAADDDDDSTMTNHLRSVIIQTRLPDHVVAALQRNPALELLCVDVNRDFGSRRNYSSAGGTKRRLPKLCLYTSKDVFVLEMGYSEDGDYGQEGVVEGTCLSVTEPFDSLLLGNATTMTIIKIRQAPQQAHGYTMMCPSEAMAMLTHDTTVNEYSLTLHHGTDDDESSSMSSLTTPLVYGVEELDEQMDRLTDFCFLQSNAFPLLSNMSVAFLKATGEVFQASPILFRGTIVPQETVTESMHYLQAQIEGHDATTARGRQLLRARQYLIDCFPDENRNVGRHTFVTGQQRTAAFTWPAQMQGPVLLLPESSDDSESKAMCIEIFPSGDLCGLVVGHDGYQIEFGLLSPTLFIPRFQYEDPRDTQKLDQDLKWGAIVTRVDLQEEESDHHPSCPCLALIRDPIMQTVVHYVTPSGVKSISSNALRVASNRAMGSKTSDGVFSPPSNRTNAPAKTTGWSCLEVSNLDSVHRVVVGAVVSGDVQFGHVLVARLSDGNMVAINMTETRQIQEMEAMTERQNEKLAITTAPDGSHSKELQVLHDTPALVDIAKPLIDQILNGLGNMGKVVGSSTPVKEVTPDMLAAATRIKEQTDMEVVLPLMELHEHVRARKRDIVVMSNNQMMQLKGILEMTTKLKEGEAAIQEKLEIVGENATFLAERSALVLQTAHDFQPTITQAERNYFQELERLNDRMQQMQEQIKQLKSRSSTLIDSIKEGTNMGFREIPDDFNNDLITMLDACGARMQNYTIKVEEQEFMVDELAAIAGWDRNPHGNVGPRQ